MNIPNSELANCGNAQHPATHIAAPSSNAVELHSSAAIRNSRAQASTTKSVTAQQQALLVHPAATSLSDYHERFRTPLGSPSCQPCWSLNKRAAQHEPIRAVAARHCLAGRGPARAESAGVCGHPLSISIEWQCCHLAANAAAAGRTHLWKALQPCRQGAELQAAPGCLLASAATALCHTPCCNDCRDPEKFYSKGLEQATPCACSQPTRTHMQHNKVSTQRSGAASPWSQARQTLIGCSPA